MLLSELLNKVKAIQVIGEAEKTEVIGITNSSKNVSKGKLFAAIKGYKTDGHKFIQDAINNGASGVILEDQSQVPDEIFKHSNVVKIVVDNSRKALALFSNLIYNEPSKKLTLIGITGTKGKTTTSYYLKHILETAGYKVGLIGTIANYIGHNKVETKLTTPESFEINELMKRMLDEGCSYCIMEVSSHSLSLNRVDGLDFNYGIFTNITADHFDFHNTFESYRDAKKILFDILSPKAKAIINIDDNNWTELVNNSQSHSFFYGKNPAATYQIKNIAYDINGTNFEIEFSDTHYKFKTGLIGEFNAYNAAAAITTANKAGIDWETIIKSIDTMPQVPGRFQVISNDEKKVIVDYSHTTDSLKQALEAINNLVKGSRQIYTVFGCGGDRDKTKRPQMGKIAEELSNSVIITSDNPRTENPLEIIDEINKGFTKSKPRIIENRDEAIKEAIHSSEKDAVVLIAGKGHEDYQEINGVRHHFSDEEKVLEYLNK
ncbi:MAG: UDP-N-acetylmuramoyl-L-alanyl-D-glutamate--2,6-diaminopimelate ligase [Bacteroidetes bacterium]|nr:UDP-N-acetylmuramoyl-L-alanyl-D-glutamate--2,6-diaminopimelate ligase [Bacteroidota bacterium]